MGRKRTGLRNRFRTGRSKYSTEHKAFTADRYGEYDQGKSKRPEKVAGRTIEYRLGRGDRGKTSKED